MKAVFSPLQRKHASRKVMRYGRLTDHPETPRRIDPLLAALREMEVPVHAPRILRPEEDCRGVHSLRHIGFLRDVHDQWSRHMGALAPVVPGPHPLVRPAGYPRSIAGRAGWHMYDSAAPVEATTWKAVSASAASAVSAARLLLQGNDPAVYALCRPPGHHAGFETMGGFCYLNNAALAARVLGGEFSRVGIIDLGIHHGNGTQDIFYDRDDVFTISIHVHPDTAYPFYWGREREVGTGAGYGFNLNIPLDAGADDEIWLGALEYACKRMAAYRPGALVVALGMDMMAGDPQGQAVAAVTIDGVERMACRIRDMKLPTVVVQEGGYDPDNLHDGLIAFLSPW